MAQARVAVDHALPTLPLHSSQSVRGLAKGARLLISRRPVNYPLAHWLSPSRSGAPPAPEPPCGRGDELARWTRRCPLSSVVISRMSQGGKLVAATPASIRRRIWSATASPAARLSTAGRSGARLRRAISTATAVRPRRWARARRRAAEEGLAGAATTPLDSDANEAGDREVRSPARLSPAL